MHKLLSVIIVNWNTCRLLDQCLDSVFENLDGIDAEIWVVDNASSDDSVPMVQDKYPEVKLILNEENCGFAGANNLAIQQSSGDYVLLLNPDTKLKPGSLSTLLKFVQANPEAGAVGARLLNADGTLQRSCYPRPTLFREFWRMFNLDSIWSLAKYPIQRWSLNEPREVDVLMGACMLVGKKILDKVGLLDEKFFMYSEEVDLCYRIQQSGHSLYWLPEAEVVHYGGQSTSQVADEMFLRLYEGKILYFRKHYSRSVVMLYKAILYTASLARLVMSPLVFLQERAKRQKNLILLNHYRHLISALDAM
jgi:GT2 family glycosyltransferase